MAVRGDACHKPTFGAVWGELCPCCYRCQGVFRLTGHPSAQTSRAGCLQGLSEPPYVAQRDVPGLQLALAAAIAVYLLREKKRVSLGAPLHCVPAATQPAPLWQWLHALLLCKNACLQQQLPGLSCLQREQLASPLRASSLGHWWAAPSRGGSELTLCPSG